MQYYNSIAKGYDELHKQEQLNKLKIIKQNLKIRTSDFLLDIGCGTAFSLDYFNCTKVGIDSAIELLKQNKKHNLVQAMAEFLPFKDKSFSIIISVTAIHHFKDIKKSLKEIKRVAKNQIALSLLKKAKNFDVIEKEIKKQFKIKKTIIEYKDTIFFLQLE